MEKENKNLVSKPHSLEGLIQYQNGAIVSKIISKKDTGSITLFAFDKGQSLSTHSVPYDAFVEIIDGKAKITISDTEFIVEKGKILIMPANLPHSVEADEQMKMLLVMIKS